MNKEQFFAELSQYLGSMPAQDLQRLKEFFSETIDDRIESGMTEAEAVAALGDPQQIICEILQDNGGSPATRESTPKNSENAVHLHEPIRSVCVETRFSDVVLRCGSLAPDETATFEGPENLRWSVADGVLKIVCDEESSHAKSFSLGSTLKGIFNGSVGSFFSISDDALVLTLPENAPLDVILHTVSGNAHIENASARGNIEVVTASGDATCSHVSTDGAFSFRTTSGDAVLTESAFSGNLAIQTISGDARLSQVRAGSISLQTTSGDMKILCVESERGMTVGSVSGDIIFDCLNLVDALACRTVSGDARFDNISAESLQVGSSSGDIALACAQIRVRCALNTSSGDVTLQSTEAASFDISTKSGDVRGTLSGQSCLYDFRCTSSSGVVRVPSDRGERPVQVCAASGDVTLTCEG